MNLNKYLPYALTLLRIVAAYMFICHGTSKFFEFPISMTGGNGAVPLFSLLGIGGVIEIIGGIMIILGFYTRFAAFILSGQMAYAYFFMKAIKGPFFFPIANGGELALLYSVTFFCLVFAGAGAFALDNRRK